MDEREDIENFSISVEQCARWVEKLKTLSEKFGERGDTDNARLMHLCSVLMTDLAYRVEAEANGNPFGPAKAGEC